MTNKMIKNRFYNLERSELYQQCRIISLKTKAKSAERKVSHIKKYNLRKPSKINITCAGKTDGGGAQLHACISTAVFANSLNLNYHHTPLIKVEHNHENDLSWEQKWESYLDLGNIYINRQHSIDYVVTEDYFEAVNKIYESIVNDTCLNLQVPHCHAYSDGAPIEFYDVLKKIQDHFFLQKKTDLIYQSTCFNIAIHARRGDVSLDKWSERYTSGENIARLINHLRHCFKKNTPQFYIFSSASDAGLEALRSNDVVLITELDVFSVLDHLVYADCLVMAKSSMSYLAGMLNQKIVLYQPFWSVCLPHWFRVGLFSSN